MLIKTIESLQRWLTTPRLAVLCLGVLALARRCLGPRRTKLMRDMTGHVVVITGGNSGIGFEIANKLARLGASVMLLCRDAYRAKTALQEIKENFTNGCVEMTVVDLGCKRSIERCARRLHDKYQFIDVLVNNATVIDSRYSMSG
jgi:short-subunit dehydrogenase